MALEHTELGSQQGNIYKLKISRGSGAKLQKL